MRRERQSADRRQRNLITAGIVVVVVALIAAAGFAVTRGGDDGSDGPVVAPAHVTKAYGVAYSTKVATGTAATDPVTVVAYEDFQCPICQVFEAQTGAFLDQAVADGSITLEYRPISILDDRSSTDYATRAANAAMCVLDRGGVKAFKKMHRLLYANQPAEGSAGLPDSDLASLAKQAGVTGIADCLDDRTFVPWIEAATDSSPKQTPTVEVAGKAVANPTTANVQAAIDAAKG